MRPILFSIGSIQLLAAPLFAGLAAMASARYLHRYRAHAELDSDSFWTLMVPLAVGTIAGGLLLYFFAYGGGPAKNWALMLERRRFVGGAFYGDLTGATLTAWAVWRLKGLPFRRVADLIGGAAPLGLAVMRLGCFQHGCCFGTPTDAAWAVAFDDPRSAIKGSLLGVPIHPLQLYEAVAAGLIFAAVHFGVFPRVRDGRLPAGASFLAFIVLYAVARFGLDFLRASDPGIIRPFGLTTAQAIALASIATAAYLWKDWADRDARRR
ncbi:MAG: prolipoprotein diacylglyceryl transferase [Elusimicrobia bacterium]|nr:prolipoprotein diacylglyceryl transferase [Elusimicrobiota bacterium]